MKVKVITNYIDKELNKELTAGQIIEVESEKRLQELLGSNPNHIVCVEVIEAENKDPETDNENNETDNEEGSESGNPDENPQEIISDETELETETKAPITKPRITKQKGTKANAKRK